MSRFPPRAIERDIDVLIGQALRSARLRRIITQEELAAALGVTRPTVTHYEAGTRSLNAAQLVLAARAPGCAVNDLVPALPGDTSIEPAPVPAPNEPIAQIGHILAARPDLVGHVLDLLETMVQHSHADASREQPLLTL